MFGIIGILAGLAVLIVLVFKKVNLVLSVLIATLIIGITNGLGVFKTLGTVATGVGGYIGTILMVFIFAAIYGQVLTDSGCAASIAYFIIDMFKGSRYVAITIPFITALLVYGGMSVFVVVFAMMPIGVLLLKESNLDKSLLPGLINFGSTTFAMTALPGTPQLNNIIPSNILGTKPTAAPVLGMIATVIFIIGGFLYFKWQIDKYRKNGLGFDMNKVRADQLSVLERSECPAVWKALLAMAFMMFVYLSLANGWFGFSLATFPSVNTAMVCGVAAILLLNPSKFKIIVGAIQKGSLTWVMPLINLCMVIGLGAVVKATPGFAKVVQFALSIPGNVYVSAAVSTNIVAGVTGSASGGIQIALEALSDSWIAKGANPEVLHRICSVASGGLDSLPHCGGLFTVFAICNETHKDGYKHLFWTTVVLPVFVTAVLVVFAGMGVV